MSDVIAVMDGGVLQQLGAAARGVPAPGEPVRGRLHRRVEPARGARVRGRRGRPSPSPPPRAWAIRLGRSAAGRASGAHMVVRPESRADRPATRRARSTGIAAEVLEVLYVGDLVKYRVRRWTAATSSGQDPGPATGRRSGRPGSASPSAGNRATASPSNCVDRAKEVRDERDGHIASRDFLRTAADGRGERQAGVASAAIARRAARRRTSWSSSASAAATRRARPRRSSSRSRRRRASRSSRPPGVDLAKLRAQVQSKNVEWDLISIPDRLRYTAVQDGLLMPLDYKMINAKDIQPAPGDRARGRLRDHPDAPHLQHQGPSPGQGAEDVDGLLGREEVPRAARHVQRAAVHPRVRPDRRRRAQGQALPARRARGPSRASTASSRR